MEISTMHDLYLLIITFTYGYGPSWLIVQKNKKGGRCNPPPSNRKLLT